MIEFGNHALQIALVSCVCGICFATAGLISRRKPFLDSALRCLHVNLLCVTFATLALVMAFLQPAGVPMRLEYVARHSARGMSAFYKITALWGGMSGSMLFWLFLLVLFSVVAMLGRRIGEQTGFWSATAATLFSVQFFFLYMVTFVGGSKPFKLLDQPMMDGKGLNPLLQNAMMAIHPPLLYIGFVAMTIPFAFAMGALMSGDLGAHWIKRCRRWTIFGWGVLALGIALGSRWAYVELGWGGIWAWDPVENASLMPWLVMTAFLHSVMIQEHRGMLKVWNMMLIMLTFLLTIFGTFLTRSGVLQSVHTFALNREVSTAFIIFMSVIVVWCGAWIMTRLQDLKSENRLESFFSREFAFLAANVSLVTLMITILIGTMLPSITEYLSGVKRSVGPAYFNVLCFPQFLLLIFLTGYGPLVAWRKASSTNLLRNFCGPALIGLACGLATYCYMLFGQSELTLMPKRLAPGMDFFRWLQSEVLLAWGTIACFAVFGFVLGCLALEIYRGVRVSVGRKGIAWPIAVLRLGFTNRRRYGGYTVHLGLVLFFAGVITFTVFGVRVEQTLTPGQSMDVGSYRLTYQEALAIKRPNYRAVQDLVEVTRDGRRVATLKPENRFFPASDQNTSEVALLSMIKGDLYLVTVGRADGGATFLAFYNPWISLAWLGVLVMLAGGLFAAWPGRPRRQVGRTLSIAREDLRISA